VGRRESAAPPSFHPLMRVSRSSRSWSWRCWSGSWRRPPESSVIPAEGPLEPQERLHERRPGLVFSGEPV